MSRAGHLSTALTLFSVTFGCARKAGSTLDEGKYILNMRLTSKGTVSFAKPEAREKVILARDGDRVVMTSKGPNPLTGTLDGVSFVGDLTDAGMRFAFTGRLVADGVMKGDVQGTTLDGAPAFEGKWNLEPADD